MSNVVPIEWFFHTGKSQDVKCNLTGEQTERRNKIALMYPIPRVVFYDVSPDAEMLFDLLTKFDHGKDLTVIKEIHNVNQCLARKHLSTIYLDGGISRDDAFKDLENRITDIENIHTNNTQNRVIITEPLPVVNGYKLYPCSIIPYGKHEALEWAKMWNNVCRNEVDEMSYVDFTHECDKVMCSDWDKMDRFGESYAGYWKREDKSNAGLLSRYTNIWYLYQLPYPKRLLLKSIEIACNIRCESVRYLNFFLELFVRYAHVAEIHLDEYSHEDFYLPTLQQVEQSWGEKLK